MQKLKLVGLFGVLTLALLLVLGVFEGVSDFDLAGRQGSGPAGIHPANRQRRKDRNACTG